MKKTLLLISFTFCLAYGNLFSKNFEFKKANPNIKRDFPTNEQHILSYSNVLEKVKTSVVNISTKKSVKTGGFANPFFGDPLFEQLFRNFKGPHSNIPQERIQRSLGSGVIVSKDGYIVTNRHVIDGADEIKVAIPGIKKEFDAKIIGTDRQSDLAVIKIEAKNLNAITFYDSDKVKVGDVVFALGNPFGVGETITQGIISATKRSSIGISEQENFIQTDASINPGNSGGALINSAGYLVGINSAIISKSGGNVGIGFAIPSNMVINIAKALIDHGKFVRAFLGVSISDITENLSDFYGNDYGALVTVVGDDTPAKKLGLKRGDLITQVDSKKVDSASSLKNIISAYTPGTTVTITYLRNKKELKGNVKLATYKEDNSVAVNTKDFVYKGLSVEPLSQILRKSLSVPNKVKGVVISKVDPNSNAASLGIREGDIIVQVEYKEIKNINDFKKAVTGKSKKRLYIRRREGVYVVAL